MASNEKKHVVKSYTIGGESRNNSDLHLLDIVKKGTTKEDSKQKDPKGETTFLDPNYPFDNLLTLSRKSAYHARCLQIKAALTVLLGYTLETEEDNKEPDDTYKAIMNFFDSHQEYSEDDALTTLYKFCYDKELFGNGFLEIVRATDGTPARFYHIPARYCRFKKIKGNVILQQGIVDFAEFIKFGSSKKNNPDALHEFIHWKNYCPDDIHYGEPDYIGAMAAAVLDHSASKFNIKRFENNMVLEHIITLIGGSFDGKTKRDIRDFFTNNFKGIDNAGKSLILEVSGQPGGAGPTKSDVEIKVEKVAADVKEGSYLGLRKDIKEEIAAAHGVPPRLVGIMAGGQLGGTAEVQEQMRMFRDITIKPRQKQLEFILNKILKAAFPENKKWKLKLNIFDISDAVSDAVFYSKIMNITDNNNEKVLDSSEIRQELGYPPRKDEGAETAAKPVPAGPKEPDPSKTKAEKLVKSLEDLRDAIKEATS